MSFPEKEAWGVQMKMGFLYGGEWYGKEETPNLSICNTFLKTLTLNDIILRIISKIGVVLYLYTLYKSNRLHAIFYIYSYIIVIFCKNKK
jgi:hypothetical protein